MFSLKALWVRVPPNVREEILSVWHTFLAAFIVEVSLFAHDPSLWSQAAVKSVLFAALRAGVKAALNLIYAQVNPPKVP